MGLQVEGHRLEGVEAVFGGPRLPVLGLSHTPPPRGRPCRGAGSTPALVHDLLYWSFHIGMMGLVQKASMVMSARVEYTPAQWRERKG